MINQSHSSVFRKDKEAALHRLINLKPNEQFGRDDSNLLLASVLYEFLDDSRGGTLFKTFRSCQESGLLDFSPAYEDWVNAYLFDNSKGGSSSKWQISDHGDEITSLVEDILPWVFVSEIGGNYSATEIPERIRRKLFNFDSLIALEEVYRSLTRIFVENYLVIKRRMLRCQIDLRMRSLVDYTMSLHKGFSLLSAEPKFWHSSDNRLPFASVRDYILGGLEDSDRVSFSRKDLLPDEEYSKKLDVRNSNGDDQNSLDKIYSITASHREIDTIEMLLLQGDTKLALDLLKSATSNLDDTRYDAWKELISLLCVRQSSPGLADTRLEFAANPSTEAENLFRALADDAEINDVRDAILFSTENPSSHIRSIFETFSKRVHDTEAQLMNRLEDPAADKIVSFSQLVILILIGFSSDRRLTIRNVRALREFLTSNSERFYSGFNDYLYGYEFSSLVRLGRDREAAELAASDLSTHIECNLNDDLGSSEYAVDLIKCLYNMEELGAIGDYYSSSKLLSILDIEYKKNDLRWFAAQVCAMSVAVMNTRDNPEDQEYLVRILNRFRPKFDLLDQAERSQLSAIFRVLASTLDKSPNIKGQSVSQQLHDLIDSSGILNAELALIRSSQRKELSV